MTVIELIKLLQTYPPDMKVVAEGYEQGYDDVVNVKLIRIKPIEKAEWYVGAYDDSMAEDAISTVFINGANKGKSSY